MSTAIRRAATVWPATQIPVFRIRLLPPGDYVAVLAVTEGARQIGRRVRRFRVEGPTADTGR